MMIETMFIPLGSYQELILIAIGYGYRLRVPHDGAAPSLVWPADYQSGGLYPALQPIQLDGVAVQHLLMLNSKRLHKMTEHGEAQRAGWRQRGLDGDVADFYSLLR